MIPFCFSLSLFSPSHSISPSSPVLLWCVGVCVSICALYPATVHSCNPSTIISHLISWCVKAPVSPPTRRQIVPSATSVMLSGPLRLTWELYSPVLWLFVPLRVIILVLLCSNSLFLPSCLRQAFLHQGPLSGLQPSPCCCTSVLITCSTGPLCLLTPTLCAHLSSFFPFFSLKKGRKRKKKCLNNHYYNYYHHFKNYGCCKAACGGFVCLG